MTDTVSMPSRKMAISQANVVIVGAGPAGIGVARVLRHLAIPDVRVLEREKIGASFQRWTIGTQFISPSFPSNGFGLTDLNAVSYDTSPAFSLRREHPSGGEYANYLQQAALAFGITVNTGIDVRGLEPDGEGIVVRTSHGEVRARFVIWAAGQFQYPSVSSLSGAEHGVHSSLVKRWAEYPGDDVLVIGGYESGIDAAIGLTAAGKSVTVLSRAAPWAVSGPDPSLTLSPFTKQRLDALTRRRSIALIGDADILGLERQGDLIRVLGANGRSWTTKPPPVLATGFAGSTKLIDRCFARDANDRPILTPQDESTELPGLFLVGPEVHHEGHIFCFIYKFRQRFAVVARAIAARMGVDTEPLAPYRANNMFLDDLSCCDATECLC